jgi:PAS domain S-box-containing protein
MNILIVDDKVSNFKLLRSQLETEGHTVKQAQDGLAALDLLKAEDVDVVISDILMPRMDGDRLCRDIRKNAILRNLPIIILSANYTLPNDVKLALDLRADIYPFKPSNRKDIPTTMNEVVAKHDTQRALQRPKIEVLTEYSKRLVDKLEEKNMALERTNVELNTARDQVTHLLKHSPAVIYSLKVEGERAFPRLISENMTNMLGFTAKESEAVDWWRTHLHPDDRERAFCAVAETIRCGAWSGEYRIRHKSGHYIWVEDNRHVVRNAGGAPTDIVLVWTNVTERRQTQNQLLRAQRLESIGTLACGVAHDINNALSPIVIATGLLRGQVPARSSEYLELIERRYASHGYGQATPFLCQGC